MAQTFTDDSFLGTHVAQTDLQNMETNFTTLKSTFSGTAAPSNQVAGQTWFDTTNDILKVRNTADAAWYGIMQGDASQKLWVYRNSAMAGWIVDTTPSDTVLAVKGGSTYTTGAAGAGSWTISGFAGHTHTAGTYVTPILIHQQYPSDWLYSAGAGTSGMAHHPATSITGTSGSGSAAHGGTWRPSASVGTIQYLSL